MITNKPMISENDICKQFRIRGRRVTPQRRAIVRALLEDHAHPTAEQIFTQVHRKMPDISPATVYNTLHELVEMDLLLELDLGLGERHYDLNTADHAHLVCRACGSVSDVPFDFAEMELPSGHEHGFQVVNRCVTFFGYCPDCAPREED
jgi:Fe2+ or Zn2+ uptake regulation protein